MKVISSKLNLFYFGVYCVLEPNSSNIEHYFVKAGKIRERVEQTLPCGKFTLAGSLNSTTLKLIYSIVLQLLFKVINAYDMAIIPCNT